MEQYVDKASIQLDYYVRGMESLLKEVMYNADVIDYIQLLQNTDEEKSTIIKKNIEKMLFNALANQSFSGNNQRRVTIIGLNKKVLGTASYTIDNLSDNYIEIPYFNNINENLSKYALSTHADIFSKKGDKMISEISIIRDYTSRIIGYIEVQQDFQKLQKILIDNDFPYNIAVIDNEGKEIFSNFEIDFPTVKLYKDVEKKKITSDYVINSSTHIYEMIAYKHSYYTDWTVFAVQSRDNAIEPLIRVRNITLTICLLVFFLSLIYIIIVNYWLTDPLKKLKNTIENVNIYDINNGVYIKSKNDEIEVLNQAFNQMLLRLKTALNKEVTLKSLFMKAHLDQLQSQINPHFLYNMLDHIAIIGEESGSKEISKVCQTMAEMYRYSSSVQSETISLGDEINHITNYLSLMKLRLEDRLEYSVDICPKMMNMNLSKLGIQPFIENSFKHGYRNMAGTINIKVIGVINNTRWNLLLSDNGPGFDDQVLIRLRNEIAYFKESYQNDNFEVDGRGNGDIGIINTYRRLLLLFKQDLQFEITNLEDGGALITISGSWTENC